MDGDAETATVRSLRDGVRPQVGSQDSRKGEESDRAGLRAAVLAVFLEEVDTVARPAHEAIKQLEAYRDLDEAEAKQLWQSIRWVYVTMIHCLREQRQFTGREVARMQDIGAVLARLGIPLGDVHNAFASGLASAESHLRVIASAGGD